MRNSIRLAVTLSLSLLQVGFAYQAPKCTLTLDAAPDIRGIRLAMTLKAFRELFPEVEEGETHKMYAVPVRQEKYGISTVLFLRNDIYFNQKLEGLARLEVQFLDEKVSQVQVGYDDSVKWGNLAEFRNQVTEALKLTNAWQPTSRGDESVLECRGFNIIASLSELYPTLYLSDMSAPAIIEQRKREEEEKAKKRFKP
jgi:hypothetical protein